MFGLGVTLMMAAIKTIPAHWVLAVMVKMQPYHPQRGVRATYDETAEAIAYAANTHPLFAGEDGAMRTAALLLSIAYYESRFNPTVIGDHGKSFGLFQIQPATVPYGAEVEKLEGLPAAMGNFTMTANVLLLPRDAALVAVTLIKTSMRVCGHYGWREKLGWYVQGGEGCKETGRKVSVSRMLLAEKITRENPLEPELADNDKGETP